MTGELQHQTGQGQLHLRIAVTLQRRIESCHRHHHHKTRTKLFVSKLQIPFKGYIFLLFKFLSICYVFRDSDCLYIIAAAFAGMNLANQMASHMVGSLKKNPKNLSTQLSASSPSSTSYNTLPSHRHLRAQQGSTPSPKQYVSPTHQTPGSADNGIQATPPMGSVGGMSHSHTLGRLRNKRGSPGSGGRNAMSYHPLLLPELDANQQYRGNGHGKNGIGSGSKIQHHTVFLHGTLFYSFFFL